MRALSTFLQCPAVGHAPTKLHAQFRQNGLNGCRLPATMRGLHTQVAAESNLLRTLAFLALCLCPARVVCALDPAPLAASPSPSVAAIAEPTANGEATPWTVDASWAAAVPTALEVGLAMGPQVGASWGKEVTLGAVVGMTQATEYTENWTVTHREFRARGQLEWRRSLGAGSWLIRLAAGATAIRESRLRHQGERIGTPVPPADWALVPAAEFQVGARVRLHEGWQLCVATGPALRAVGGAFGPGWLAQVGLGWSP